MWEESLSKMFNTCDHLLKKNIGDIFICAFSPDSRSSSWSPDIIFSNKHSDFLKCWWDKPAEKAYSPWTREVRFLGPPTFLEHSVPPCPLDHRGHGWGGFVRSPSHFQFASSCLLPRKSNNQARLRFKRL